MKVYVGNLPFSIDDDRLREIFAEFGEIEEVQVIKDKFSGRSKGFGFVTFATKEDAEKAISKLNDKEVEGRNLKVNEAKPIDPDRPRPPRRDFGGGGGRGGGRDFGGGGGRGRRY
jgi:RNA recognition motif-containing protein